MERKTEMSTEQRRLQKLRERLDSIDGELALLIQRRGEIVREIHDLKAAHDLPVRDWSRELEILERVGATAGPYPVTCLQSVWATLIFWAPATRR